MSTGHRKRRLKHENKLRDSNKHNENAKIIFKYHKYTCVYCHEKFPFEKLTREHIYTFNERGRRKLYGDWRRIVPACAPCNTKRGGDPLPDEFREYLLKIAGEAADYRNKVWGRRYLRRANQQRRENGYPPYEKGEWIMGDHMKI